MNFYEHAIIICQSFSLFHSEFSLNRLCQKLNSVNCMVVVGVVRKVGGGASLLMKLVMALDRLSMCMIFGLYKCIVVAMTM